MPIKEENLIPVEGIIKAGQRLVKIGETFVPIGFGGNFEPGAVIYKEEGRDTYYKCASVGETTWDGYALVLGDDGYYTISETLTTGLSYGIGYTPKVDGVYNANVTIDVSRYNKLVVVPEEGLIFYAPLSSASDTAETGQTYTIIDTVSYENVKGFECANFSSGYMTANFENGVLPSGNSPRTVSGWFYDPSPQNDSETNCCWAAGTPGVWFAVYFPKYAKQVGANTENGAYPVDFDITTAFHHVVVTYDGSLLKLYIDGVLKKTDQVSINTPVSTQVGLGWDTTRTSYRFTGYTSAVRIYNRALSEDEVTTLYKEFTA